MQGELKFSLEDPTIQAVILKAAVELVVITGGNLEQIGKHANAVGDAVALIINGLQAKQDLPLSVYAPAPPDPFAAR